MGQGKVLEQHQPLRMVQRALVDGQPAEPVLAEHRDQLLLADVQRHGRNFDLGDGHIIDPQLAQIGKAKLGGAGGRCAAGARIRIAVPVLPHIANFDDLDPLALPIKAVTTRQGFIGARDVFPGWAVDQSLGGFSQQVHATRVVCVVVGD